MFIAYWLGWLVFLAWVVKADRTYVLNGWWMVLVGFWFTSRLVPRIADLDESFQPLGTSIATIVAGLLVYETYDWLMDILSGLSVLEFDKRLKLLSFPLQALLSSILTALLLAPRLRWALGRAAPVLLFVAALPVGFVAYGADLLQIERWSTHALANSIGLFETIILPLIVAATAHRISMIRSPIPAITNPVNCVWRGETPLWVSFIVYPLTLILAFWLRAEWIDLAGHGYSAWKYDNVRAILWLALIGILLLGTIITFRVLARRSRTLSAMCVRLLVIVIAAPFLAVTVMSEGFRLGEVFNHSLKVLLGNAYTLHVKSLDRELVFSGLVTYGLADALEAQLHAHPEVRRISLESPGGIIREGFNASLIIRAHELDTLVTDECASSCTIMFVAGKARMLGTHGRLGFHGASGPSPNEEQPGAFRWAYGPYALAPTFVARVEATKPPALWYPERSELIQAGVL